MLMLFNSLVDAKLSYCPATWGPHLAALEAGRRLSGGQASVAEKLRVEYLSCGWNTRWSRNLPRRAPVHVQNRPRRAPVRALVHKAGVLDSHELGAVGRHGDALPLD